MNTYTKEEVMALREVYKPDTIVRCLDLGKGSPIPKGTLGKVRKVDMRGFVEVDWAEHGMACVPMT